ncbi:hypothetical protein M404DRAFT_287581 [Pisolithus tinctorius Marx 270]|uniref:Uncharacterized protein n=1 Tax=Pisolithus tinctorius Marx 270 TaxID=870435 RepID=A0A0C3KJI3_PISTI|nr:hypothetical protein M404DRAFT_287581 [Pisolithus tinctorius Marx 270]
MLSSPIRLNALTFPRPLANSGRSLEATSPQQELFRNQDLLLTLENRKNCISPFCQASPPHLQPSMEVNHRPSQYPAIVPPRPGKDIVNSPNSSKTIKMVATYLVPSTLDLSPTCIVMYECGFARIPL